MVNAERVAGLALVGWLAWKVKIFRLVERFPQAHAMERFWYVEELAMQLGCFPTISLKNGWN